MTGVLTKVGEDLGKGWVLEVLCDDVEFDVAEAPDEADELEVTEVGGDPNGAGFAGLIFGGRIVELNLDMRLPVTAGEAARPEKVDKGAGKILIGAATDFGTLFGSVFVTKGHPKVFKGSAAASGVEPIRQVAYGSSH